MNRPGTRAEFWLAGAAQPFVALDKVGPVPSVGQFVSISKRTYEVTEVTWAIDHADDIFERALRVNIEVKETP